MIKRQTCRGRGIMCRGMRRMQSNSKGQHAATWASCAAACLIPIKKTKSNMPRHKEGDVHDEESAHAAALVSYAAT